MSTVMSTLECLLKAGIHAACLHGSSARNLMMQLQRLGLMDVSAMDVTAKLIVNPVLT